MPLSSVGRVLGVCGLLGLLLTGCNDNPMGLAPVTGTVTLDGAPLDQGSIHFESVDGGNAVNTGAVIENGKYAIPAKNGLKPGKFKVAISSAPTEATITDPQEAMNAASAAKPPANRIPPQYNNQTTLEATVTESGPNSFDFDLKSK